MKTMYVSQSVCELKSQFVKVLDELTTCREDLDQDGTVYTTNSFHNKLVKELDDIAAMIKTKKLRSKTIVNNNGVVMLDTEYDYD